MRRLAPVSAVLLLAALGGCHKQEAVAPQAEPAATPAAALPAPLAVVTTEKGKPAAKAPFTDLATNGPTTLAAFRGKPLLVNLWATWCGPCVRELPMLDALAKARAGKLAVVAISEDLEGAKVVLPFLRKQGVALHPYHDDDNGLMLELKEAALPLSILYDAEGREVWRVPGDLDWTGAKAKGLLAEAGV